VNGGVKMDNMIEGIEIVWGNDEDERRGVLWGLRGILW